MGERDRHEVRTLIERWAGDAFAQLPPNHQKRLTRLVNRADWLGEAEIKGPIFDALSAAARLERKGIE